MLVNRGKPDWEPFDVLGGTFDPGAGSVAGAGSASGGTGFAVASGVSAKALLSKKSSPGPVSAAELSTIHMPAVAQL